MNYKYFVDKIPPLKGKSQEEKMMVIYRYLSLFITSFFFLIGEHRNSILVEVFIVLCISISSVILNYLIIRNRGSSSKIKLLILIEMIGISVILIPTGGINSPYIWYSLNTILVTSIELDIIYFWLNLLVYFFSVIFLPYQILSRSDIGFLSFIQMQSNLILSFLLITALIQLLARYFKEVRKHSISLAITNLKLMKAHHQVKETINYVLELYQAVHHLTSQTNSKEIINLIMHYTKVITKTTGVLFCSGNQEDKAFITVDGNSSNEPMEGFKNAIIRVYEQLSGNNSHIEMNLFGKKYMFVAVRSMTKMYGILGIELIEGREEAYYKDHIEQLQFLSELGAIVFERHELDEIRERLIINEEQKRIANEIHDSVLQRLFSVSCGIFAISRKCSSEDGGQTRKEFDAIRDSIDNAMKELRVTIYGLNLRKNESDAFENDVNNYINDVKRFNKVDIKYSRNGNPAYLSPMQKKAFYRIICEGISNAIRHGRADSIKITLNIKQDFNILNIIDNGVGFSIGEVKTQKYNGLGLKNMQSLAFSHRGNLLVDSEIGKGTSIVAMLPNKHEEYRKVEVV